MYHWTALLWIAICALIFVFDRPDDTCEWVTVSVAVWDMTVLCIVSLLPVKALNQLYSKTHDTRWATIGVIVLDIFRYVNLLAFTCLAFSCGLAWAAPAISWFVVVIAGVFSYAATFISVWGWVARYQPPQSGPAVTPFSLDTSAGVRAVVV